MSEPITFTSATARFSLPLLFAGQSQKEFFVNEALSKIDFLIHPAIEGIGNDPPPAPLDGQIWLVSATATGDWSGKEDQIAIADNAAWQFFPPLDGLRVFDRSNGTFLHYDGGWTGPIVVTAPSGGSTIDLEARTAISALIDGLAEAGIFSQS